MLVVDEQTRGHGIGALLDDAGDGWRGGYYWLAHTFDAYNVWRLVQATRRSARLPDVSRIRGRICSHPLSCTQKSVHRKPAGAARDQEPGGVWLRGGGSGGRGDQCGRAAALRAPRLSPGQAAEEVGWRAVWGTIVVRGPFHCAPWHHATFILLPPSARYYLNGSDAYRLKLPLARSVPAEPQGVNDLQISD